MVPLLLPLGNRSSRRKRWTIIKLVASCFCCPSAFSSAGILAPPPTDWANWKGPSVYIHWTLPLSPLLLLLQMETKELDIFPLSPPVDSVREIPLFPRSKCSCIVQYAMESGGEIERRVLGHLSRRIISDPVDKDSTFLCHWLWMDRQNLFGFCEVPNKSLWVLCLKEDVLVSTNGWSPVLNIGQKSICGRKNRMKSPIDPLLSLWSLPNIYVGNWAHVGITCCVRGGVKGLFLGKYWHPLCVFPMDPLFLCSNKSVNRSSLWDPPLNFLLLHFVTSSFLWPPLTLFWRSLIPK